MNTKFLKNVIGKKLRSSNQALAKRFFGSASHSHDSGFDSGSGSDHHHDHHHHRDFFEERVVTEPWSTYKHIKSDKFDVLGLIEKLREPVQGKSSENLVKEAPKNIAQIQSEYISFLADTFKQTVSSRYPEYRTEVESLKKTIPGFERMNSYQQEVQLLDAYMRGLIKANREESMSSQVKQGVEHLSKEEYELEQINHRIELLGKLTVENESDTRILKSIKKKLKKVLESDKKYSSFLVDYSKELESKVLQKVVEKKKVGYSVENTILNKELNDLKSPLNPNYHPISVTPHDNIQIDNWNSRPDRVENERYKYLALYDVVLDQHLRRVRPENLEDDTNMYNNNPVEENPYQRSDKDLVENIYFDYVCRNHGEFYRKFVNEVENVVDKREVEDENRPVGKLWDDEHKYPHVADRIGWDEFAETPIDKNIFVERIESVPNYQWQPFTQTPSLNSDPNLDLELGETLYEDKWGFEWALLWKLLLLAIPICVAIETIQHYDNNLISSTDYRMKHSFSGIYYNVGHNSQSVNRLEKLNYWGQDLWYYQHWIRKLVVYTLAPIGGYAFYLIASRIGATSVIKATFNRNKDVLFIWTNDGLVNRRLHICELHYLEKNSSNMATSNLHNAECNGNISGGQIAVEDKRRDETFYFKTNQKYWNHDLKAHFDSNTNTYWKGVSSKDVNRGILFNNSIYNTQEELDIINQVEEELKSAIIKFGPIQSTDYETNFKYQLGKKLNENRVNLISGMH